jgi:hypothetical protein
MRKKRMGWNYMLRIMQFRMILNRFKKVKAIILSA